MVILVIIKCCVNAMDSSIAVPGFYLGKTLDRAESAKHSVAGSRGTTGERNREKVSSEGRMSTMFVCED